jgi:F420-0:gamma-glutamyl ligase-like protein
VGADEGDSYSPPVWTEREIAGVRWRRGTIRTPFLTADDDLPAVLDRATAGHRRPGDVVCVSEKVSILLTGRAVDTSGIKVGRLARTLAGRVRPMTPGDYGMGVPTKMQYLQDQIGTPRMVAAAGAHAVLRPFGVRGMFYRVAGPLAKYLDGGHAPYWDTLFPPLSPDAADRLATECAERLGDGVAVAIVDVNDRDGTVRGRSAGVPATDTVRAVLRDNPMGQTEKQTPVVLVRKAEASGADS